ncbi:MAG: hypothetical protein ACP5H2_07715 [Solirubrobacteraceae bacterium]
MHSHISFAAPLAVGLALPLVNQARLTGTVLSISQAQHHVQVITVGEVIHTYSFSGTLKGVRHGTEILFTANGAHMSDARTLGATGLRDLKHRTPVT